MSLRIIPRTLRMAGEDQQLEEMLQKTASAGKGETLLFSEYGAYTVEGSRKTYSALSKVATARGVTVITSLNLPTGDLPDADENVNYNTLCIFSRNGKVYSPQAKITPQSFEMQHLDRKSPRMNVAPYSCLNRVKLKQGGREHTAFFFICSDLYALRLFAYDELKAEAIICTANFGNGAEESAGDIIRYAVESGVFKQGFLCNSHQIVKKGLTPLTLAVERVFPGGAEKKQYAEDEMEKIVNRASAVYPDEKHCNFQSMLKLTQNGTFTIPQSRSIEQGLKVKLGSYERIIEL